MRSSTVQLAVPDLDEPVTLTRRTGRRRITVFVFPDNRIEVRSPGRTPVEAIYQFVASTTPWIRKRLAKNQTRAPVRTLRFVDGESIPFKGSTIELCATSGRRTHFDPERKVLYVPEEKRPGAKERCVKAASVVRFFEREARHCFENLIERYAPIVGRAPVAVTVRGMKSRWGSCSAAGRISLNWRILCAPPEAAEYLVVHEMCHLIHRNHSKHFWASVEKAMPGFKEARKILKQTGSRILALWER